MSYIFVYGTLKTGMLRNHVLTQHNGSRVVGQCWVFGKLLNYRNSFPVLTGSDDPTHRVLGELWGFMKNDYEEIIPVLDDIEGYPLLFDRTENNVYMGQGMGAPVKGILYRGYNPDLLKAPEADIIEWKGMNVYEW